MKEDVVAPKLSNFINSLRDVGYDFEVAVADLIDNSISANADIIEMDIGLSDSIYLELLDDGIGMSESELTEAMRLAAKNPFDERAKDDLGRFGLGLKTSSFSQCRKLTFITKKNETIVAKRWDLDYIAEKEEWLLLTLEIDDIKQYKLFNKLKRLESGSLVVWEGIDRFIVEELPKKIVNLDTHLSIVFHRFLEGVRKRKKITMIINGKSMKPFNPFNASHPATQELGAEKIILGEETVEIQPYILPHHSKVSHEDYDYYSTQEGYIKSQGFYLYRANRLLIHGTWWGMHKACDAHKLVRVRIDINNRQDVLWGIDIKKSKAHPAMAIKNELKRIIKEVTKRGSRPYTGRGKKLVDKTVTRLWTLVPDNEKVRFDVNYEHPLLVAIMNNLETSQRELLMGYLKCLAAYLPVEAIQAQLQVSPHRVQQKSGYTSDEKNRIYEFLKSQLDENEVLSRIEL